MITWGTLESHDISKKHKNKNPTKHQPYTGNALYIHNINFTLLFSNKCTALFMQTVVRYTIKLWVFVCASVIERDLRGKRMGQWTKGQNFDRNAAAAHKHTEAEGGF